MSRYLRRIVMDVVTERDEEEFNAVAALLAGRCLPGTSDIIWQARAERNTASYDPSKSWRLGSLPNYAAAGVLTGDEDEDEDADTYRDSD